MTAPKTVKPVAEQRAQAWAASPEGQAKIQEALDKSERTVEQLREARRIDPDVLTYPITV